MLAGALAVLLGVVVALSVGQERPQREPAAPSGPAPSREALHAADSSWVGTWSAAPSGPAPEGGGWRGEGWRGSGSVRNVLRVSAGGTGVRVELSNRYGTHPVTFRRATVALGAGSGPAAEPGSLRPLTFRGQESVSVHPGDRVRSDPVALRVPAGAALLVTVFVPESAGTVTRHRTTHRAAYLAPGDHTADVSGAVFGEGSRHWRYVSGVQVLTRETDAAVVVLGDSLTDRMAGPPDAAPGSTLRWTDLLARRLREDRGMPDLAVLNQGISGNRLLQDEAPGPVFQGTSGLGRLETDVLSRAGVRTVVVQLGINDLRSQEHSGAQEITAGLRELAERARARGLRVVGVTLTPFGGNPTHGPALEAERQQVNAWIRSSGVFDAVIDWDAALRDPARPQWLLRRFDSGDGLHPGGDAYGRMAAAVDLQMLTGTAGGDRNGA